MTEIQIEWALIAFAIVFLIGYFKFTGWRDRLKKRATTAEEDKEHLLYIFWNTFTREMRRQITERNLNLAQELSRTNGQYEMDIKLSAWCLATFALSEKALTIECFLGPTKKEPIWLNHEGSAITDSNGNLNLEYMKEAIPLFVDLVEAHYNELTSRPRIVTPGVKALLK